MGRLLEKCNQKGLRITNQRELVISIIENSFDQIIITQSNIRNYTPASELSQLFSNHKIDIISDLTKAIQLYKRYSKDTTIIIAGSHYLGPSISKEFKISFDNI